MVHVVCIFVDLPWKQSELYSMKYSIKFEENINQYNSLCFHGKSTKIHTT
jgi:hypothetical protein